VTHEYTILVGGIVIPGGSAPDASAIAWAADTVLAVGTDAEVRSISRGDSHFVELVGATVIPLNTDGGVRWPADATLEVGCTADLAILRADPRLAPKDTGAQLQPLAVIRAGRVVAGALPGDSVHHGDDEPLGRR
jgi:predicted amidohydrolase YtcJ